MAGRVYSLRHDRFGSIAPKREQVYTPSRAATALESVTCCFRLDGKADTELLIDPYRADLNESLDRDPYLDQRSCLVYYCTKRPDRKALMGIVDRRMVKARSQLRPVRAVKLETILGGAVEGERLGHYRSDRRYYCNNSRSVMMRVQLLGLSSGAGMAAVFLMVVVGLEVAVYCKRTFHGITSSLTVHL